MKVSVIIPTHNRPEMLKRALLSVLAQSYRDLEVIVVDDGLTERADQVVASFADARTRYIPHEHEKGGGAARNTGIKVASGEFIAFLDDDDEWMPDKLTIQMASFGDTSPEVGFCFCAVENMYDSRSEVTKVPEGIADYHNLALDSFKVFLTVTLIIKKSVFEVAGVFDEKFPSHQESDLMIRVTESFKGLGINQALVKVDMKSGRERTGSKASRRIAGREMLLAKHYNKFIVESQILASHLFWLGLSYRDSGGYGRARSLFWQAFKLSPRFSYFGHVLSLSLGSGGYKIFKAFRKRIS